VQVFCSSGGGKSIVCPSEKEKEKNPLVLEPGEIRLLPRTHGEGMLPRPCHGLRFPFRFHGAAAWGLSSLDRPEKERRKAASRRTRALLNDEAGTRAKVDDGSRSSPLAHDDHHPSVSLNLLGHQGLGLPAAAGGASISHTRFGSCLYLAAVRFVEAMNIFS
jgi:hypothetical protein